MVQGVRLDDCTGLFWPIYTQELQRSWLSNQPWGDWGYVSRGLRGTWHKEVEASEVGDMGGGSQPGGALSVTLLWVCTASGSQPEDKAKQQRSAPRARQLALEAAGGEAARGASKARGGAPRGDLWVSLLQWAPTALPLPSWVWL